MNPIKYDFLNNEYENLTNNELASVAESHRRDENEKIPTLAEDLRRTGSSIHNIVKRQHQELAELRARGASPTTLKHFRKLHMEERRRRTDSPLPSPPPQQAPGGVMTVREMTREQLLEKQRHDLEDARTGSPEFLEWTKSQQAEQLRNWEAAHENRSRGRGRGNSSSNSSNNAEAAFGEPTELPKFVNRRPRRRTIKQRKARRQSRRNRR